MRQKVINIDNKVVGDIELDQSIFGLELREDILHRVVEWQRAKKRSGNHKTKGISEISGTTKKPYKQKGTGNARQGSLRSAQMRGGAVIFGPIVRSHAYDLPKKVRRLGLKIALSSKLYNNQLLIVDEIKLDEPKTSLLDLKLKQFDFKSALFIDGLDVDSNFNLAVKNLYNINLMPSIGANVYDILRYETLVLTRNAIEQLQERLK